VPAQPYRPESQIIECPTPAQSGPDPGAISVVIPAYNEAPVIRSVAESLLPLRELMACEILIVDDGSTDGTAEILAEMTETYPDIVRVLTHRTNRGYGAALKTGIRHAQMPLIATLDADGQHTLDQLMNLMPSATQHEMVIGQRTGLRHSPMWRMPGKWLLGRMADFFARQHIPDLNSGLRIFHSQVIRQYLHLFPNGFSFSTTSTLVLLNRGYSVDFVPIAVQQRQGHSTVTARTGFETILLILRLVMLLTPLRIFLPLSLLSVFLGLAWAIPYLIDRRGLTVTALLFLINGILIFLVGLLADQVAEMRKERFEDSF